ncbi:hypothetical protein [Glaciibacter psychrotolerans]|uniref:Uncharacterized protein n=1 Tax=Glaciibacter psychrotolerans TaxID=670054 RepID=A0A7Z0EE44_9MICO|nr:hypothetical protein [Leifsonia psychrotolerans]NYJ19801.1 hypothetical protein [Leifsonia psychrotolerans]
MASRATTFGFAATMTAALGLGLLGCSAEAPSAPSGDGLTAAPPAAAGTALPTPRASATATQEVPETGNATLPADFPRSVPVVSGTVERSESHGNESHGNDGHGAWLVWMTVDDVSAAAVTARDQLTVAGFVEESWHADDRKSTGVFTSADHRVVVVAVDNPNHREFLYKVFTS